MPPGVSGFTTVSISSVTLTPGLERICFTTLVPQDCLRRPPQPNARLIAGSELRKVHISSLNVKVTRTKTVFFRPFRRPACGLCLEKHLWSSLFLILCYFSVMVRCSILSWLYLSAFLHMQNIFISYRSLLRACVYDGRPPSVLYEILK